MERIKKLIGLNGKTHEADVLKRNLIEQKKRDTDMLRNVNRSLRKAVKSGSIEITILNVGRIVKELR